MASITSHSPAETFAFGQTIAATLRPEIDCADDEVDPRWAALGELRERLADRLDQKFVPLDSDLGPAREVAIFPPVTGG